jgi:hypothetical protein
MLFSEKRINYKKKFLFLFMDKESKQILQSIGFHFNELDDLNGLFILREQLISEYKYEEIKILIPKLKNTFSSSRMTCLHKSAVKYQKWPLINLVRQILHAYNYKMTPIRKADGYTLDGIKKYKRFFKVEKQELNINKKEKMYELELELEL